MSKVTGNKFWEENAVTSKSYTDIHYFSLMRLQTAIPWYIKIQKLYWLWFFLSSWGGGKIRKKKVFFSFLGLHPWHTEAPRLGVGSELQLPICTTATAMQDLNCICNQYHSSWQRQILNPMSEARDRAHILMDTNWVHYSWATTETPEKKILNTQIGGNHIIKELICYTPKSVKDMSKENQSKPELKQN